MSLRGGPSGRRGNPHPPRSGPPRTSAPTWLSLWESCRRSRLRGPAGASVIFCPPITGNSPCHVIARRPIGPTRQSASPAKRAAEDVGPYLALPLGELSAQPTERACRGVGSAPPVGPALPGRVKPGPYKTPLIPDCQKRLAEFAARRPRISVPSIFRGGVYAAKNTLRFDPCVFVHFCVKTHGSKRNLFCQKRQRPFLTSSYYPRTQDFRALPSGSSTRRPSVTLTSGAAARISATDVSMPLLPLVQKGFTVLPVRS